MIARFNKNNRLTLLGNMNVYYLGIQFSIIKEKWIETKKKEKYRIIHEILIDMMIKLTQGNNILSRNFIFSLILFYIIYTYIYLYIFINDFTKQYIE